MMPWMIVSVLHGSALDFNFRCKDHSVVSYCPVIRERRRGPHLRKPVEVVRAAYPGYVFVHSSSVDRVVGNPFIGTFRFLRNNSSSAVEYACLSDEEMERVKSEEGGWFDEYETKYGRRGRPFNPGDQVEIIKGMFKNRRGVVRECALDAAVIEVSGVRIKIDPFLLRGNPV